MNTQITPLVLLLSHSRGPLGHLARIVHYANAILPASNEYMVTRFAFPSDANQKYRVMRTIRGTGYEDQRAIASPLRSTIRSSVVLWFSMRKDKHLPSDGSSTCKHSHS